MSLFNWIFKKKELSNNETIVINKNIIRQKCHCGHKKAKQKNDGSIICRKCKSIILGA